MKGKSCKTKMKETNICTSNVKIPTSVGTAKEDPMLTQCRSFAKLLRTIKVDPM